MWFWLDTISNQPSNTKADLEDTYTRLPILVLIEDCFCFTLRFFCLIFFSWTRQQQLKNTFSDNILNMFSLILTLFKC
mgnify:CR=1 FL=1